MRMPVITLYGPWANWVSLGWKTIETRLHDKFRCLAGRRIGIHVAAKWDEEAINEAAPYLTESQRYQSKDFLHVGGAIICTAHVRGSDWLTGKDSAGALIDCGSRRRFGLFLSNVNQIEVIPCKGKQGIWYHDIPD